MGGSTGVAAREPALSAAPSFAILTDTQQPTRASHLIARDLPHDALSEQLLRC
jgi:hypothetical protein